MRVQVLVYVMLLHTVWVLQGAFDWHEHKLQFQEHEGHDFVMRWHYQHFCQHVHDPRTSKWRWATKAGEGVFCDPAAIKAGDTVFVRDMPHFFKTVDPHVDVPYIVVSAGECLDMMKARFKKYLDNDKVIAWFGVHPNDMAMHHKKFKPLPLGVQQAPKNYEARDTLDELMRGLRSTTKKEYLVYMNFAEADKPERKMLRELLEHESYVLHPPVQKFTDYLRDTAKCCFVLSPAGRAPDAYRTWEAILCGSIPVVVSSELDPLYKGLPVLILDDWKNISEDYLAKKYEEMVAHTYDIAPLYAAYWTKQIAEAQAAFLKTWNHEDEKNT